MELTTFPFALGKESFHQNSRNESKINLWVYTEILFQLINEDFKSPFVRKIFKNERCKSIPSLIKLKKRRNIH